MFQFAIDDGTSGNRYKAMRSQHYRMTGLRHNPYVGSFHGKSFQVNNEGPAAIAKQFIMEDSKGNPLIGVFRHSPSTPTKSLGLKSILYREPSKPLIFAQFQAGQEPSKIPPHNILRSLRQIPTKVFTTSSLGTRSTQSVASPNRPAPAQERPAEGNAPEEPVVDANAPTCSICLAPYVDGDELRTFACSHCFHNECVSKWIFHRCLDNNDLASFNCPECRQNHVTLSEAGSSHTSLAEGAGISSQSFLQVGENMARDIGYDFLSDFGSELGSPCPVSAPASPRFPVRRPSSTGSTGAPSSGSGEDSPTSECCDVPVLPSSTLSAPVAGASESSPRGRPPVPFSPGRRTLPMRNAFGARMPLLHRSGHPLLGIFPVPEDSYLFNDSAYQATASPAAHPAASPDQLLGAALVVSTMSTSSAESATTRASSSARPVQSSLPPFAAPLPAWAAVEPLSASEYSDCGLPLQR